MVKEKEANAAFLEKQSKDSEDQAVYKAALDQCIIHKRTKKTYYSQDAPRMECAADATRSGRQDFIYRYLPK